MLGVACGASAAPFVRGLDSSGVPFVRGLGSSVGCGCRVELAKICIGAGVCIRRLCCWGFSALA